MCIHLCNSRLWNKPKFLIYGDLDAASVSITPSNLVVLFILVITSTMAPINNLLVLQVCWLVSLSAALLSPHVVCISNWAQILEDRRLHIRRWYYLWMKFPVSWRNRYLPMIWQPWWATRCVYIYTYRRWKKKELSRLD